MKTVYKFLLVGLSGVTSPHLSAASLLVSMQDHYLNGRIDQMAVLADLPVMQKPYNVQEVLHFLPRIQHNYPGLHQQIAAALNRYTETGIRRAELTLAYANAEAENQLIENGRGERRDSRYRVSGQAQWYGTDWFAVSAGVLARESPDDVLPLESYLVAGTESFQFELGSREQWLSPFRHSAMLMSTNARPSVSARMSNPLPFEDWWNLHYAISVSRLEPVDRIRFGDTVAPGRPWLMSTHLSFEPSQGWTIGLTRTFQFGGGPRDTSFGDIWEAFIDPVSDNPTDSNCEAETQDSCELGNQQAAVSSRMNFGGNVPFSLYFEYAGEDTSEFSNSKLGNLAASGGIYLPVLFDGNWSLNYEFSEWQNSWYTHHLYLDGYTNDGVAMGHWGANERETGTSEGARAQVLEAGWQIGQRDRIELAYHRIENASYATTDYKPGEWLKLRYISAISDHELQLTAWIGRNVYDDNIARLEASFAW